MVKCAAFVFCRVVLMAACSIMGYAAVMLGLQVPLAAWLMAGVMAWKQLRTWCGTGYAFGTARWATLREVAVRGFLGKKGFIVGRTGYLPRPTLGQAVRCLFNPFCRSSVAYLLFSAACYGTRLRREPIIRLQSGVHTAVFASSGSGKNVSIILPNVLSYPNALVVLDPQGMIFRESAKHRQKRFGHRIVLLDPFSICGKGTDGLNPLDFVDPSAADFVNQCDDVANALVTRTGTEREPHWNDKAQELLSALIAYVCACEPNPEYRNLSTVRKLVSSRQRLAIAAEVMKQVDGFGGVIREKGHQISSPPEEEFGSIVSCAQRHTAFLDSPAVAAATSHSSFDPRSLRLGKLTAYMALPPERLMTLSGLLRIWTSTILRVLVRDGVNESQPVLMILDEAGHLGKMQILEDAVTTMRAYGIRLVFIFQSLAQLTGCFGEDGATKFLDNMDIQVYFGVNSIHSATAISRLAGEATILIEQFNVTDGYSHTTQDGKENGSHSSSTSITRSETKRSLLMPDEAIRLPDDLAIVFHKNMHPLPVRLLRYYDAPEFKRGGVGRQRGPGVLGVLSTLCVACFSVLATAVALSVPEMIRESQRKAMTRRMEAESAGESMPYPPPFGHPYRRPWPPYQQHGHRMPFPVRGREFRYP